MGSPATGTREYLVARHIALQAGTAKADFATAFTLARLAKAYGSRPFNVGGGARSPLTVREAKRLAKDGWLVLHGNDVVVEVETRAHPWPWDSPEAPYELKPTPIPQVGGRTRWMAQLSESALHLLAEAWSETELPEP